MRPAVRAVAPPLVVAALLLARGRTAPAIVAVVAAFLLVQAALLAPERVAAATHAAAHAVGRIVTLLLLVPLYFLVFVPAALIARAVGVDPLDSSGSWRPGTPPSRRRHTFADDRHQRHGRSWRSAVALVTLGAVIALAVPAVLDHDDGAPQPPVGLQGASFNALESPALAQADWVDEAGTEFAEASAGLTYTSYVGSSLRDYDGEYVNVNNRQRSGYEATPLPGTDPLEVWFFGGSTMFGFSAQRDEHTIPSEIVRLAEDEGRPIVARNYGAPGYVNFQETVLLAQLLADGGRPDAVVFYDGINDTAVLVQQAFGGIGTPGDPADIVAFSYRNLLAGQLTATAAPPTPLTPVADVGRPPEVGEVVDALMDVYGQGRELAQALGRQYGFAVLHYWQPDLFTKELVEGEIELIERLGMDRFRFEALARVSRSIPPELPADVVDLTDAYAGEPAPVLTDQVHTNELGAALIAGAMWDTLGPVLARRADGTLPP